MARFFGKRSPRSSEQPVRPLFERVQDWVFEMDVKSGTSLFRVGMFVLLVLLVILVYTGSQFYGLRDRSAMDMGQIARNVARGHGYTTQVIRPLELAHLRRVGKPPLDEVRGTQPELFTPPGYPLLLGAIFKVITPSLEVGSGRTIRADRLMMVIGWLFFLAAMILTYALAHEMFDHRAAVLALFLFLFCEPILDNSIAGVHLNFLMVLFLIATYGVIKAEKWTAAGRSGWWTGGALVVSGLAVGWGTLTQYTFSAVILTLIVYLVVSFPKTWLRRVMLVGAVMLIVILPWIVRNLHVSRTFFGLSYYEMMEKTGAGTDNEVQLGDLQRRFGDTPPPFRLRSLVRKALLNTRTLYETTLKDVGAGYLIAFFLVSLLHRWRNEEVFRLRRFVFWCLLLTLGWLAVAGLPERNFLIVFMPVIIIYAAAFFYVLFERLQFRTRLWRYGSVVLFAALNCVPLVGKILPPATTVPYPPYDANLGLAVGKLFDQGDLLASDIPWAFAWYADQSTLWMPRTEEEYLAINDRIRYIAAVHFSQATIDRLKPRQLVEALVSRTPMPWLQTFPLQAPPENFPLRSIQVLTPDRQQFLISNLPPPEGPVESSTDLIEGF